MDNKKKLFIVNENKNSILPLPNKITISDDNYNINNEIDNNSIDIVLINKENTIIKNNSIGGNFSKESIDNSLLNRDMEEENL